MIQLLGARENYAMWSKMNHDKFVHAMDVARAMFVRACVQQYHDRKVQQVE